MNSNIINVILIKKCYQKGTFVKDATSIVFDLKNLFTLGNSVSLENWPSIKKVRSEVPLQKICLCQRMMNLLKFMNSKML